MTPAWRVIEIDRGDAGVRLDRVLLRHLRDEPGLSRNQIQKWIDRGDVLINGTLPSRAAWRVQMGDDLRVRVERRVRARPSAEVMSLDVIYEDDHLLAINKPAGLVVHPSYKNVTGTLINGVLQRARTWPAGDRPGLLGRLDKYTSGLVIVTKRPAIQAALQRAMDARRIEKDYLAIVWGKPTPLRGTIDLALDRDPWDRRRITVTDRGGQPSVTRYERLATTRAGSLPAFSLVRCRLITGRTHQIRVHLSAKGWPLVGDATYGRRGVPPSDDPAVEAARAFPRQALHAWRLAFRHPVDGTELELTAPLPDDVRALCSALKLPTL